MGEWVEVGVCLARFQGWINPSRAGAATWNRRRLTRLWLGGDEIVVTLGSGLGVLPALLRGDLRLEGLWRRRASVDGERTDLKMRNSSERGRGRLGWFELPMDIPEDGLGMGVRAA